MACTLTVLSMNVILSLFAFYIIQVHGNQQARDAAYDDYNGYPSMEVFTRRVGSVPYPPPRRNPLPPSLRQKRRPQSIRRHWTHDSYDLQPYESQNSERRGLFGGAGSDLLLASLPFVFAPLVGMLMAPLTLPTQMAAASLLAARAGTPMVQRGKRDVAEKQSDLEKMRQRMIARYMRCSGLLSVKNHCVEKLACDFAALNDFKKSKRLEREVTAMLITNILHNPHINESFKSRMKKAAQEGKKDPSSCPKFQCAFEDTMVNQSAHSATQVSGMKQTNATASKNKRRKHKNTNPEPEKLPELFEF